MGKGQFKYADVGESVKIGYTNPDNPASVVIQLESKDPKFKSTYATTQTSDAVKGLQDGQRWQVEVPDADAKTYPAVQIRAYGCDSLDKAGAGNFLDSDFIRWNVNESAGKPVVVIKSSATPTLADRDKPKLTKEELEALTPIRQWIVGYLIPRVVPSIAGVEIDGEKRFDIYLDKEENIGSKWDAEATENAKRDAQWSSENGGKTYDQAYADYQAATKQFVKDTQAWIKSNPGKPFPPELVKPKEPPTKLKDGSSRKCPHYTTCGAMTMYIGSGTSTPLEGKADSGKRTGLDAPITKAGRLGGLIGIFWAGKASDGGGWVTARPTGPMPKPGDLYLLSGKPQKQYGPNTADAIDAMPADDKSVKAQFECMHVGVVIKASDTEWTTADAGQGGPPTGKKDDHWTPMQRTAYSTRPFTKSDPVSGECMMQGEHEQSGNAGRRLAGWVDVDLHPWKNKPQKFADLPDPVKAVLGALGVTTSSLG